MNSNTISAEARADYPNYMLSNPVRFEVFDNRCNDSEEVMVLSDAMTSGYGVNFDDDLHAGWVKGHGRGMGLWLLRFAVSQHRSNRFGDAESGFSTYYYILILV